MITNKLIKKIATKLEKEANQNHIFRDKLIGNLIRVPVLKNPDIITVLSSGAAAFNLEDPMFLTYKDIESTQYLVRLQIAKNELTEDNVEDVMKELASSLKRNIGLRDNVITYGPLGRLTFTMPGRGPEDMFLLESADGLSYELRAYADIALAVRE